MGREEGREGREEGREGRQGIISMHVHTHTRTHTLMERNLPQIK